MSSLNAVSVLVRIFSGLIAFYVIARFIGPTGLAITGNLRNVLNAADTFSTLGIQNGVIKYVAEDERNKEKLYRFLSTVFITVFTVVVFLSIGIFLSSHYLNRVIFDPKLEYYWVFNVLAFTLPWHAANIIFMAVINGLGKFKQVISVNIAGNVLGLAISVLLIWKLGLTGAMLGLVISPALMFIFSFYLIHLEFKGFSFLRRSNFDIKVIRRLLSYSLMSLVTAVLGQIIFIVIRNTIAAKSGLAAAGYWEAINRISFFYLMFITTLLTVYFLPKLSVAANNRETREVFYSYYKSIVPVFVAGCAVIYILRYFIITVLMSDKFLPMENLFFWQLVGDIFKVCSLILGYQFFAKRLTTAFIVTELISFTVLYFSSVYLINLYGTEGAVMAHAVTYVVYFVVLIVYFRKIFQNKL